jgi:hypothetical protein
MFSRKLFFFALLTAMGIPLSGLDQASWAQERWHGDIRYFHVHDQGLWRRGHWWHGWHGGAVGWWWLAGGAWYAFNRPVYPYPDPYIPSTVIIEQPAPQPAPVVVAAPAPPPAPQPVVQAPTWYYCKTAKAYYPYVSVCAEGWTAVPATPPPPPAVLISAQDTGSVPPPPVTLSNTP